ncbi:phenylalanine--tRNA ligase subunit beta [Candidatus Mesenet endosymbiont of Agriotes lineatus]|uniref:phenylalanine--tRNA ligase subunit beta n=1 Tax=Candidatus Mesenet endosymbiont of Agriotes lineatus TaxID=3077948 RepID=UPI0030D47D10
MKFTLSWLLEYLETDATLEKIANKLTSIGLEVEEVIDNSHLSSFVIAQITEVLDHPNADRLKICKVNNGRETLQIVCGANNVKAGMKTVLAQVSSILPVSDATITATKIRGVLSNGMLCSADELGLSIQASTGIIELPDSCKIGESFFSCDSVIDVNITPNRGDCLSVYGIARDLVATGIGALKARDVPKVESSVPSPITLQTTDEESFISGRYISSIKNAESPKWLKDRLQAIGLRSVSTVVDITNYVMLSFGKPLHAYDADKINGQLIVQKVNKPREFTGLDGKNYSLADGANIIADDKNIHGIAGIIGAKCSQCLLDTKNIFLESAWFNPISIAKTSRSIGLSTEASYRFERFADPEFVINGLNIATEMILNLCGGSISDVVSAGRSIKHKNAINFDYREVNRLGSVDIPLEEVFNILIKLGFTINRDSNDSWSVCAPSWRSDIQMPTDLVEEVVRIYGYEKIKEEELHICDAQIPGTLQDKLRVLMSSRGLNEVLTWSFMDEKIAEKLGYFNKTFLITNPLNSNLNIMRPSIVPNLLQIAESNIARGIFDLAIFEIGPVYNDDLVLDQQKFVLSGLRSGNNLPRNLYKTDREIDAFDVKADFMSVLHFLDIDCNNITIQECDLQYYHPGKSAIVRFNNRPIGYFGELHPNITDLKQKVMCFEIILSGIEKLPVQSKKYIDYKYQNAKRDFAFLVDKDVAIGSIIDSVKNSNLDLITDVFIFDVYKEINDYPSKMSVAFSVILHSPDHTLTEDEIKKASDIIINAVGKNTGGELRSA